jgi:colanic acid biosynthesis protein WcaH
MGKPASKSRRAEIIALLESGIGDPAKGLPDEVFLFLSRISPMINVDLLVKNKRKQTLLTWREDGYCSPGWHIPGGIIRYKETIATRIKAVAATELGADVGFRKEPLAINEIILPPFKNRGHFISVLYKCHLISGPDSNYKFTAGVPAPGQWAWHSKCPKNLIDIHKIYKEFI